MKISYSFYLGAWLVIGLLVREARSDDNVAKALTRTPIIEWRAPGFASWVIDRSGLSGNDQQSPKDNTSRSAGLKMNVVKTDQILVQSTVDADGKVWSTWCIGGTEVTVYPNKTDVVVMDGSTTNTASPFYTDYTKTDFPAFGWLSPTNCGGRKVFNGHTCLVFFAKRDPVNGSIHPLTIRLVDGVPSGVPSLAELGIIAAYVDEDTRFPVGIQEGKNIQLYNFLAPPQAMLSLPDPVQAILKERDNKAKAAIRKIPNQP